MEAYSILINNWNAPEVRRLQLKLSESRIRTHSEEPVNAGINFTDYFLCVTVPFAKTMVL